MTIEERLQRVQHHNPPLRLVLALFFVIGAGGFMVGQAGRQAVADAVSTRAFHVVGTDAMILAKPEHTSGLGSGLDGTIAALDRSGIMALATTQGAPFAGEAGAGGAGPGEQPDSLMTTESRVELLSGLLLLLFVGFVVVVAVLVRLMRLSVSRAASPDHALRRIAELEQRVAELEGRLGGK